MESPSSADDRAPSRRPRGCRLVTTSLTARVLLANQLRRLDGIDWTVVSGDSYDDAPDGVSVRVVPMRREFAPADIGSLIGLWRLFRRERFDVVQTHTPKASFLGLPAARLAGSPAVYTVHGALYFDGNGAWANVLGWIFERWCCQWAVRVLVQSREDERVLPAVRICPTRKVTYVGNGVVMGRFLDPVAPVLRSDRPIVMMVSRLVREKGCADFLSIAESLAGRAEFVHVGPTEHDQSDALTEEEVDAARSYVQFVGAVEDVRPFLASADVVVLPSYREGIPRAVIEASVMGRPVAAYDIRGVREVVDPASGLLAPRGDRAALAGIIEGLLDDPVRAEALGARGRARVVEHFDEDRVIERLDAVYAALGVGGDARDAAP